MAALRRPLSVALNDGRDVVLRSAQPQDARRLARLIDEVAAEPEATLLTLPGETGARQWRRRIRDAATAPRALLLVALADDIVVGQVHVRPEAHRSRHVAVIGIAVAKAWRGVGLGTALVEAALLWAATEGYVKAALSVFATNAGAIGFYEAQGFAREGLRRAHLRRRDEYHDEMLMARFLIPPPVT